MIKPICKFFKSIFKKPPPFDYRPTRLYVYHPLTSENKATYSNPEKTIRNTQPIILDKNMVPQFCDGVYFDGYADFSFANEKDQVICIYNRVTEAINS